MKSQVGVSHSVFRFDKPSRAASAGTILIPNKHHATMGTVELPLPQQGQGELENGEDSPSLPSVRANGLKSRVEERENTGNEK